jgi:hypothetical protein
VLGGGEIEPMTNLPQDNTLQMLAGKRSGEVVVWAKNQKTWIFVVDVLLTRVGLWDDHRTSLGLGFLMYK